MSCVNEQRCGPLHLLVRECGSSATGSQQPTGSFMLKTVTDMWQHAGLMCSKDIGVCLCHLLFSVPASYLLLGISSAFAFACFIAVLWDPN